MAQQVSNPSKAPAPAAPARRAGDVFSELRQEVDRLFDNFTSNGWRNLPSLFSAGDSMPSVDVRENETHVTVEADIPGMEEKDVSVTLRNGVLSIKGEKKTEREEKKDDYYLCERSSGSFERSIQLPDTIDEDKVDAVVDKGVLKVTLAKKPEAVRKARTIPIGKVSGKASGKGKSSK
jgi:HSP20 family protein